MKAMKAAAMKAAPMKAMKAAKVMKAKVMKAMKAPKKISARLAKRHAFLGKREKTAGGLTKGDLVKNKAGKIVSKKASLRAKKNKWILAVTEAKKALKITGFHPVKKGSPVYLKAK